MREREPQAADILYGQLTINPVIRRGKLRELPFLNSVSDPDKWDASLNCIAFCEDLKNAFGLHNTVMFSIKEESKARISKQITTFQVDSNQHTMTFPDDSLERLRSSGQPFLIHQGQLCTWLEALNIVAGTS